MFQCIMMTLGKRAPGKARSYRRQVQRFIQRISGMGKAQAGKICGPMFRQTYRLVRSNVIFRRCVTP